MTKNSFRRQKSTHLCTYVGNIFKLWTFTLGHTIPDISPFLKDVLLDMPLIHVGKNIFFHFKIIMRIQLLF